MESGKGGLKATGRCWLRLIFILLVCLAALLASVAFGKPAGGSGRSGSAARAPGANRPDSNTEAQLTVRIYNYAHLDSASLALSEKVAAGIFESLAVRITWLDCPLSPAQLGSFSICQSGSRSADLVLRILPQYMATKLRMEAEPMGYARPCPEDAPACELTVFYYRVDELAAMGYRADRILGYVIAHEMAHVLIGPGHSENGIMRGIWSPNDLQRISWGLRVGFTSDESERLRSAIMRRTQ